MIKNYKKKPVVIEALLWTGDFSEMQEFCSTATMVGDVLSIPTLEGDHTASVGDYIIKGIKNEFYPCKPDIFFLTYDYEGEV